MNKKLKCLLLSSALALLVSALALASCGGHGTSTATDAPTDGATAPATQSDGTEPATLAPEVPTEPASETPTETPTEAPTEVETYPAWVGDPNAKTVNLAASLANRVTGYYNNERRNGYIIENTNATLHIDMSGFGKGDIALLANRAGKPYFTNSCDTFIRLQSGTVMYANTSTARANLYDQGYYYYDVHILDQTFGGSASFTETGKVDLTKATNMHSMSRPSKRDDGYLIKVKSADDPYVIFGGLQFDTAGVDAVLITLKTDRSSNGQIFFIAGSQTTYTAEQSVNFSCHPDGEYHDILVPLVNCPDYTGSLKGVRLDIGSAAGEQVYVQSIKLVKFNDEIPRITLDRDFIAYSDKINDNTRFMAKDTCNGIDAVGTVTRIPADTVDKLVVFDKSGRHDSLDGVDQNSIEYVGFDIKEAGIFGYILLPDAHAGSLSLTREDGMYVLTQAYTPAGNQLKKGDEVTVGHRLYTDPTHDFEAFLYEAYCERNPLEGVTVLNEVKGRTYYAGYNALRGVYEFMIENAGNFSSLYENPDRKYPVTFTVDGGDTDRRIYIFAHTTTGSLECAAVLDGSNRMLPIPVEVNKNFAHDGEELYYTQNDSIAYGYAVFPMVVERDRTERLTVVHMYERWGLFRLKQLSSIRFHQAYYHQSLGVTETNCIAFYNYGNRLPDHRALSQPYWGDTYLGHLDKDGNLIGRGSVYNEQPQHANNGTHTFLHYVDADGRTVHTESRQHYIASSGPTYYDLTMDYISNDGKLTASIRHMEMPQYDENRCYTQLDYEVLDTVSVKDFKTDFEIYAMTTNQDRQYQKLGYLNGDGQPVICDVNDKSGAVTYVLGNDHPYFDYFKLPDTDPAKFDVSDIYSNLSTLIKDWDIVIGGERYTGPLVLVERNSRAVLTLDLGEVTLQPGDHIRINMILMPWGDCHSEDDSNVRLARENTLLNPIRLTSDRDTVLTNDPWLPAVRSANGQEAVFTISGGLDNIDRTGYASEGNTKYKTHYDRDFNVTARVYGLHDFGTVGVYELIDGEWVSVQLASDDSYDGYAILYDADNTFSVSFVINMNEAKPRTFRVVTE